MKMPRNVCNTRLHSAAAEMMFDSEHWAAYLFIIKRLENLVVDVLMAQAPSFSAHCVSKSNKWDRKYWKWSSGMIFKRVANIWWCAFLLFSYSCLWMLAFTKAFTVSRLGLISNLHKYSIKMYLHCRFQWASKWYHPSLFWFVAIPSISGIYHWIWTHYSNHFSRKSMSPLSFISFLV